MSAPFPNRPLAELTLNLDAKRRPVKSSDRKPGPFPYYGAQGIVDYVHDYLFDGEYVLVAEDGENLRSRKEPIALLSRGRFWVNNHAHILQGNEHADTRFLYYAINAADVSGYVTGSTIPKLSQGGLNRIIVPCPPVAEQLEIVQLLGSLDDKIELNRRMNETLEAMAQAIFRDWFVDFGPTRRKFHGTTDPVEIMGGLVSGPERARELAALFPAGLGDEGLPEGWEARTLGDDFDVVMGQSPPGSTYNEIGDGLPFFQGRRDFQSRFPERRVFCSAPSRIAEADWTLVSVRAPVGDINRAWERCCIGRGVGAMMHKQHLSSFTYYTGLHLKDELATYDGDGTVFGSINQSQLKRLAVAGGNTEIAPQFDAIASPMDELIRRRTEENRNLVATRDLLLPKLMSGEVRLNDAEAALEAAQ